MDVVTEPEAHERPNSGFTGLFERFKAFWSPMSMLGMVASFTGDNFLNECCKYVGSKDTDSLSTSRSGAAQPSSEEGTILPYSGAVKLQGSDSSRPARQGVHHQRSFSWPLAAFSGLLDRSAEANSSGRDGGNSSSVDGIDDEDGNTIHRLTIGAEEPHHYGKESSHAGTVMSFLVDDRHRRTRSGMVPLNAPLGSLDEERALIMTKSASCGDLKRPSMV